MAEEASTHMRSTYGVRRAVYYSTHKECAVVLLFLGCTQKHTRRRASGCLHGRACSSEMKEIPCLMHTQTRLTHTPEFSPITLLSSCPRHVQQKLFYTKQDEVGVLLLDTLETSSDLAEELANEHGGGGEKSWTSGTC